MRDARHRAHYDVTVVSLGAMVGTIRNFVSTSTVVPFLLQLVTNLYFFSNDLSILIEYGLSKHKGDERIESSFAPVIKMLYI